MNSCHYPPPKARGFDCPGYPHGQPIINSSENPKSIAHTVANNKQSTTYPRRQTAIPTLIPMHHLSSTLCTDDPASRQLPPFLELEVNDLGEGSQLTNITPVMEPSFGDLAASASSRDRTNFVWHPINGEEVCTEDGRIRWQRKRCTVVGSLYLMLMCRSWLTVTQARKSICTVITFGLGSMKNANRHLFDQQDFSITLFPFAFRCSPVCGRISVCCGGGRKLPVMAPKPRNPLYQTYAMMLVDHEISIICPPRQPTQSRPVRLQKSPLATGSGLMWTASHRPVQFEAGLARPDC